MSKGKEANKIPTVIKDLKMEKGEKDCLKPKDTNNSTLMKIWLQFSQCHYKMLLVNISAVYLTLGLLISLQPPFFPSEAEKKGATPSQYGFMFGITNLTIFIISPIFGKYGSRIGPKLCFNIGAVLQGVSGFLCAFLTYCTTTESFIGLAYTLRALEGLGEIRF